MSGVTKGPDGTINTNLWGQKAPLSFKQAVGAAALEAGKIWVEAQSLGQAFLSAGLEKPAVLDNQAYVKTGYPLSGEAILGLNRRRPVPFSCEA